MRFALLAALLSSASAMSKPPVCTDACFCESTVRPGVVEARISAVTGERTTFVLESVTGIGPGSSVFELPRVVEDAVDARWLIFLDDTAVLRRLPIDASGNVHCLTVALTVSEARQLFEGPACQNTLRERGYEPDCTPRRASCSAASGSLAMGALCLLIRRRFLRRRHAAISARQ